MTNPYTYTHNATEAGVAICNADILNENLEYLKYKTDENELRNIIKSCKVDGDGNAELLEADGGDLTISIDNTDPFVAVYPNGQELTFTDGDVSDLSSKDDGTYSVIIDDDGAVDLGADYQEGKSPLLNAERDTIPVMTDNTSPYGEASTTGTLYSTTQPYYGFITDSLAWTTTSGSVTYEYDIDKRPGEGTYYLRYIYNSFNFARTLANLNLRLTYLDDSYLDVPLGTIVNEGNVFKTKETLSFYAEKTIKNITISHSGSAVSTTTSNIGNIQLLLKTYEDSTYWLDTSKIPNVLKKFEATEWVEKQGVYAGSVTVDSGVITEVKQPVIPKLNQLNNFARTTNGAWIVETYQNGSSWYRIWSDGWIEQGGNRYLVDTIVNLFVPYKNTTFGAHMTRNTKYSGTQQTNEATLILNNYQISLDSGAGAIEWASWYTHGY